MKHECYLYLDKWKIRFRAAVSGLKLSVYFETYGKRNGNYKINVWGHYPTRRMEKHIEKKMDNDMETGLCTDLWFSGYEKLVLSMTGSE